MSQRHLETVVGKPGSRVVVLAGPHAGERGRLLGKHAGDGTANLQLAASFDFVTLPLEHVADYVGEEEDE